MNYPKIGIRPVIDGRRFGMRESYEEQTRQLAETAAELIRSQLRYTDGSPVECVISPVVIGGGTEAAQCQEFFAAQNVVGTLSVTPCWCYGMETLDNDPLTFKAIWGFNATEAPGAVYLAAAMAAHAQIGLPAYSIYGRDVQEKDDRIIPTDVQEKILRFARCAVAAGCMRNRAYVNLGGVSMGIVGSYMDMRFFTRYLGLRPEWVDLTEVLRRIHLEIYDREELEKALAWVRQNCPEGDDNNPPETRHSSERKAEEWKFVLKMTLIFRDILQGNPKLAAMGYQEEALGKNAIAAGFQGQRAWTDWLPNGDFAEAILNSGFDWNGKRPPLILATENDTCNAAVMLFENLLTQRSAIFADVRTYWSPDAVKRVTGQIPQGEAAGGFIHLINSGAAALDATGAQKDEQGNGVMKPWWELTTTDISACLKATRWAPASLKSFRGGGFSSQFSTQAVMPVTMARLNIVDGVGPTLQIAEGSTVVLPPAMNKILLDRTDPTWPSTWFVPRVTGEGAFRDVYTVMTRWGANHAAFCYGHIGADLVTLASMLRIPVVMHNLAENDLFIPHAWPSFAANSIEDGLFQACKELGPLY